VVGHQKINNSNSFFRTANVPHVPGSCWVNSRSPRTTGRNDGDDYAGSPSSGVSSYTYTSSTVPMNGKSAEGSLISAHKPFRKTSVRPLTNRRVSGRAFRLAGNLGRAYCRASNQPEYDCRLTAYAACSDRLNATTPASSTPAKASIRFSMRRLACSGGPSL